MLFCVAFHITNKIDCKHYYTPFVCPPNESVWSERKKERWKKKNLRLVWWNGKVLCERNIYNNNSLNIPCRFHFEWIKWTVQTWFLNQNGKKNERKKKKKMYDLHISQSSFNGKCTRDIRFIWKFTFIRNEISLWRCMECWTAYRAVISGINAVAIVSCFFPCCMYFI